MTSVMVLASEAKNRVTGDLGPDSECDHLVVLGDFSSSGGTMALQ